MSPPAPPSGESFSWFGELEKNLGGTNVMSIGMVTSQAELAASFPEIPGYRILAKLGEGGMGIVYLAQQTTLNRTVALKMIRPNAVSNSEYLARFLREAESIAALQHPHIVQIYESGTHGGAPYFALEYCSGGSLQSLIGDEPQPAEFAVRIVEQLTSALSAVHAAGIVHRDLKPDNILLVSDKPVSEKIGDTTPPTGRPSVVASWQGVAKVTDFGLARQVNVNLTQSGQILGTPTYMAPEQASGEVRDLGPSVDIWALGVILYRMITGRVPFRSTGIFETLMLVMEAEPVPPRQLVPKCPKDIETIILKCLHKDPTRRYQSAAALGADLQAWRQGQPISARPVSMVEQAWKLAKRYPVAASLAGLVVLFAAAMTGLAGWAWQLKDLAELNARQAEMHAQEADREAVRAIAGRKLAREALQSMTDQYISDRILQMQDVTPEDKEFLHKVLLYHQQLVEQDGHTPEARSQNASSQYTVAWIQEQIGLHQQALANYSAALEQLSELVTQYPDNQDYRWQLAKTQQQLAIKYENFNDFRKAESFFRAALVNFQTLHNADPTSKESRQALAGSHNDLAALLNNLGKRDEALREFQLAYKLRSQLLKELPQRADFRRHLASILLNLSVLHSQRGEAQAALEKIEQAIALHQDYVRVVPRSPEARRDLGFAHRLLASQLAEIGQPDRAKSEYEKALKIYEVVVQEMPAVPKYRHELATVMSALGNLARRQGQIAIAQNYLQQALLVQNRLVQEHPTVAEYQYERAGTHVNLGVVCNRTGQADSAKILFEQAATTLEKLQLAHPNVPEYRQRLATVLTNLGNIAYDRGDKAAAREKYLRACQISQSLSQEFPDNCDLRHRWAVQLNTLGLCSEQTLSPEETIAIYRQAIELFEQVLKTHSDVQQYRIDLAGSLCNLSNFQRVQGSPQEAIAGSERAIELLSLAVKQDPQAPQPRLYLRNSHMSRAEALELLGLYPEAARDWQEARRLDSGPARVWMNLREAQVWLKAKQPQLAAPLALAVLQVQLPAELRFRAASILAECVAQSPDEKLANEAVSQIRRAWVDGNRDLMKLQQSPELQSLRGRVDFQAFLAEVRTPAERLTVPPRVSPK